MKVNKLIPLLLCVMLIAPFGCVKAEASEESMGTVLSDLWWSQWSQWGRFSLTYRGSL